MHFFDFYSTCTEALKTHRLETLNLLALLADAGYLNDGLANIEGGQWKVKLGRIAGNIFEQYIGLKSPTKHDIQAICKLLKVCSVLTRSSDLFLPALTSLLEALSKELTGLTESEAKAAYNSTPHNKAYLFACGLKTLAELRSAGVQDAETVARAVLVDIQNLMSGWSWNRGIVAGAGELADCALSPK